MKIKVRLIIKFPLKKMRPSRGNETYWFPCNLIKKIWVSLTKSQKQQFAGYLKHKSSFLHHTTALMCEHNRYHTGINLSEETVQAALQAAFNPKETVSSLQSKGVSEAI